jgi:hypothetical protein
MSVDASKPGITIRDSVDVDRVDWIDFRLYLFAITISSNDTAHSSDCEAGSIVNERLKAMIYATLYHSQSMRIEQRKVLESMLVVDRSVGLLVKLVLVVSNSILRTAKEVGERENCERSSSLIHTFSYSALWRRRLSPYQERTPASKPPFKERRRSYSSALRWRLQ